MTAPQDVAQTLWALAKVGLKRPKLLRKLAEQTGAVAFRLNAKDVASIAWAFGSLAYRPDDGLLNTLAAVAVNIFDEFEPQASSFLF